MTPPGYNEADTRAKLIDPALHARQWIELVKEKNRLSHGEIHREQSAVRIDMLDGKLIKRGRMALLIAINLRLFSRPQIYTLREFSLS